MRVFDSKRQDWVAVERERRLADLHQRDAGRQRAALRGAAAVLAVCGLAFGTWAVGWKDEPEPTVYFSGPVSAGADTADRTGSGSGSGSGAPSPSSEGAGLPSGYESVADPEGFRIALPIGWARTSTGADYGMDIVNYRNLDGTRRVQVYEVSEPTPYASVMDFLDETKVPKPEGFRRVSLERLSEDGRPAVRLAYVTDRIEGEPDVGLWYVEDHRFQGADGKRYAVAAYGVEARGRGEVRELLDTAVGGFCPPGTVCG
ncbi:hypothetical protein [Streptomyces sp. G45]|uniref:hypothetical protein n=1 Tax=Streptomyces sp. G45 TaxID=3406627 RepID=UPI003C14E356